MPPAGRAEGIPQIYHKNATIVENWEGILGQQHWVFYGPTLLTPSKSLNIDCHNRTFQAKLWWLKHPFYDTAHRPIYNIFFSRAVLTLLVVSVGDDAVAPAAWEIIIIIFQNGHIMDLHCCLVIKVDHLASPTGHTLSKDGHNSGSPMIDECVSTYSEERSCEAS